MASVVCEHCMAPVAFGEAFVCREGFSYHEKCKKCYVCSETNLHNAEIFRGVIFCANCAKRIFQGCSTTQRTKAKPRWATRRRDRRGQEKRPNDTRVIERALLGCSRRSSGETTSYRDLPDISLKSEPQVAEPVLERLGNPQQLKQMSTDYGMNTDALPNDLRYSIEIDCGPKGKVSTLQELNVIKDKKLKKKVKNPCSDLRIAELGASTEIASMALRKQSELTYKKSLSERVTNSTSLAATQMTETGASHSGIRTRPTHSTTTWSTHSESPAATETGSDNSVVEWLDSVCNKYRVLSEANRHMFKCHLGSIITLPFKLFKKNIIMRSSLVSLIVSNEAHKRTLFDRIKTLFYEEIPKHRERGIRRLYSTINKRRTPYKLGWLKYEDRTTKTLRPKYECLRLKNRCKHFHASHSYRCMRAQVMRLAGPTKSEMRRFRRKVKNSIVLPWSQNEKFCNRCLADKTSEACGVEESSFPVEPKCVRSI